MTPQRALIEAAQKAVQEFNEIIEWNKFETFPLRDQELLSIATRIAELTTAISSAKAAEEGVETECEHVPVCDERGPKTKERCRREAGHSGRHTGRSEGWYTSVREKEGL